MTSSRHKPPPDSAYRTAYERGWNASKRWVSGSALDRADDRNEPDAWYDGYHDAASERDKWHLWYCRLSGGCEEHHFSQEHAP